MGWIGEVIGSGLGQIGGGLIGGAIGQQEGGRKVGGDIGKWVGGFLPFAKGGVARPEQLQGMARGGQVLRVQPKPYLNAMALGGMARPTGAGRYPKVKKQKEFVAYADGGMVADMQREQFMTRTMPLGAAGRGRRRR